MAQKQILPPNIRVDRNCQPTWVTQNAIPEEQELILLGGGHDSPPPTDTGLISWNAPNLSLIRYVEIAETHSF